jgi:hypothetical protein
MWRDGVGLIVAVVLLYVNTGAAQTELPCLEDQEAKIARGLRIAPVPLNLAGRNRNLVGLGSYIVNAQGGCNDCHTSPSYAPGGDPFRGEPEQINTASYLAGGREFGSFIARNITPCAGGKPAGLTFAQFLEVMRHGKDFKDGRFDNTETPILQVMPWPVYRHMTRCDLRAIYAFLRTIPPHNNNGCTPGGE